jgi:uncharacterized membrane protein YhhN
MRQIPLFFDWTAWLAVAATLILVFVPQAGPVLPWIKALPALAWGVSFLAVRTSGWGLMAPALGAAALGDFLLAGNSTIAGAAAFAVMQVIYIVRFWTLVWKRPRPRRGLFSAPLIYATLTGVILLTGLVHAHTLALPIVFYSLLLAAMASGSAAAGLGWTLAWGGALFFLSDSLILFFGLWPMPFNTDWAVLAPYYLGQALIVRATRRS